MSGMEYKHEDEAKVAVEQMEMQTGYEFDYIETENGFEVFQTEGGNL